MNRNHLGISYVPTLLLNRFFQFLSPNWQCLWWHPIARIWGFWFPTAVLSGSAVPTATLQPKTVVRLCWPGPLGVVLEIGLFNQDFYYHFGKRSEGKPNRSWLQSSREGFFCSILVLRQGISHVTEYRGWWWWSNHQAAQSIDYREVWYFFKLLRESGAMSLLSTGGQEGRRLSLLICQPWGLRYLASNSQRKTTFARGVPYTRQSLTLHPFLTCPT